MNIGCCFACYATAAAKKEAGCSRALGIKEDEECFSAMCFGYKHLIRAQRPDSSISGITLSEAVKYCLTWFFILLFSVRFSFNPFRDKLCLGQFPKLLFLIASLAQLVRLLVWFKTITIGILDTIDPGFMFKPSANWWNIEKGDSLNRWNQVRRVVVREPAKGRLKQGELDFFVLRVDSLPMWQNLPARAIL